MDNREKTEKQGLLTSAYLICFCDLLITTINQKSGYWASIASNSVINESNKIIQFLMAHSRIGIHLITILYALLLFVLIMKLPLKYSRIIGLASILMNTTGFVSWIWFDYIQFLTFISFLTISFLTITLTFPSKNQRKTIKVIFSLSMVILSFSILYALYQIQFSEISKFLDQKTHDKQRSNEQIFNNDFFIDIDFGKHTTDEIDSYQWPFIKLGYESIIFAGEVSLDSFSTIIMGVNDLTIKTLQFYLQMELQSNSKNIETGKILYIDYPSKEKKNQLISFGSDLVTEELNYEIDKDYSQINYYIQYSKNTNDKKYTPQIGFLDFNIITNKSGKPVSRYNLTIIDEKFRIIDLIKEGLNEGYITNN